MTKRCARCKEDKPIETFGVLRVRGYKANSYCRACQAEMTRLHRAENRDEIREKDRRRRVENRDKLRAHSAVRYAIKTGKIVRDTACHSCGRTDRRLEGHHFDGYAKEAHLRVHWLCRSCHHVTHGFKSA